jgi:hypothetical protein
MVDAAASMICAGQWVSFGGVMGLMPDLSDFQHAFEENRNRVFPQAGFHGSWSGNRSLLSRS